MNDTNQSNKNAGDASVDGDETSPEREPDHQFGFAREVDLAAKRADAGPDETSDRPGYGFAPEMELLAKRQLPRPRGETEGRRPIVPPAAPSPAGRPSALRGLVSSMPALAFQSRFATFGLTATIAALSLVSGATVWSAYEEPGDVPVVEEDQVDMRAVQASVLNQATTAGRTKERGITESAVSASSQATGGLSRETRPDTMPALSEPASIPVEPTPPAVEIAEHPPAAEPTTTVAALYPSPDLLKAAAPKPSVEAGEPHRRNDEAARDIAETSTPAPSRPERLTTGAGLSDRRAASPADARAKALDELQDSLVGDEGGSDQPGDGRVLAEASSTIPSSTQRSGVSRLQRLAALGVAGSTATRLPELKPLHVAATVDTPAWRTLPPKPELKPLQMAAAINSAFKPAFKPRDSVLAVRSTASGAVQRPSMIVRLWRGLVGGLSNLARQGEGSTSPVLLAANDRQDDDGSNSARDSGNNDSGGGVSGGSGNNSSSNNGSGGGNSGSTGGNDGGSGKGNDGGKGGGNDKGGNGKGGGNDGKGGDDDDDDD